MAIDLEIVIPHGGPKEAPEREPRIQHSRNPVVETSEFVYEATDLVKISDTGVKLAARLIRQKLHAEAYSPRTWRTHALHICPQEPYKADDPSTKKVLDWIFLISALNFSFWSEKGGTERFGIEWRTGWDSDERMVHTGYWSLVAALNRALEENIPITDPAFYGSEEACPDSLIAHVFRPAGASAESIPLLEERIAVMREMGSILSKCFGGSFQGFINEFHRRQDGQGCALDLVKMVVDTFPSFRDENTYQGRKVYLWKRPQILVAETWAAFFPQSPSSPHPLFPGPQGPRIDELTMFADYRVPQILHHLRILTYPLQLVGKLQAGTYFPSGSREELSLRTASIVAVERVRAEILSIIREEEQKVTWEAREISSVLIDFFLWDLAKRIEDGSEVINGQGLTPQNLVPIHQTRSIWY
ncbi:hypothetical protein BKA70DRAFT_771907 [Coprinopsis sp. MPI-PUGE-AT-0042]|nr:hypothetical protein BKA70DRAFT_771907 [Coprinopsis sp. MPI-PUGE-AT-0042]